MISINFLALSVALFLLGALSSLFFTASPRTSRGVAAFFSLLASLSGFIAVLRSLTEGVHPSLMLFAIPPFGEFTLQMDLLSTLLVAVISLLGIGTSIYSFTEAPEKISVSFFTGLFMGSMVLVVTVTNAFFFLIFWELMTLASYFSWCGNLINRNRRGQGSSTSWWRMWARHSSCWLSSCSLGRQAPLILTLFVPPRYLLL
jgi:hydrogenase-4 component B